MDDPKILDGSDTPAKQPEPPLLYTTFKEHLKNALLALDALDQPSLAMLKHDDEFCDSVQRMLAKLTITPLSELLEQAMKDGVQSIVSRLSAHIFSPQPLNSPAVPPPVSSPPKTSTATPESTSSASQASISSSMAGLLQRSDLATSTEALAATPSQPSSTQTSSSRTFRSPSDALYPGAMVTVYFIRLVLGEWVPDPTDGLKDRLNVRLLLERGLTDNDPFVLMTFMSKKRRPGIGLVCHAHTASESVQMLLHLRKSVDAISDFLMVNGKDGDSYLVTELGVLSIASHRIKTVFP